MSDTELRKLTIQVSTATEGYQRAVAEGAPVHILMEKLWTVQDWLARFVDAASDEPDTAADLLESLRPRITTEVSDTVFSGRGPFPVSVAAITRSKAAITRSLTELKLISGGLAFAHSAGR